MDLASSQVKKRLERSLQLYLYEVQGGIQLKK